MLDIRAETSHRLESPKPQASSLKSRDFRKQGQAFPRAFPPPSPSPLNPSFPIPSSSCRSRCGWSPEELRAKQDIRSGASNSRAGDKVNASRCRRRRKENQSPSRGGMRPDELGRTQLSLSSSGGGGWGEEAVPYFRRAVRWQSLISPL
jgi:hypothetical protein